jgi:ubiquitin-protein ligase
MNDSKLLNETIDETIDENNKHELSKMSNKVIFKRLTREYSMLLQKYKYITIENDDNRNIVIKVFENDDGKLHYFQFTINEKDFYPFREPKIHYNYKPYLDFLRITDLSILKILKKLKGYNCLCCHSYCCTNNWSPAVTMEKIITEIKTFRNYKRDIIYKICIDKIKNKYLIEDINIDEYLFRYDL